MGWSNPANPASGRSFEPEPVRAILSGGATITRGSGPETSPRSDLYRLPVLWVSSHGCGTQTFWMGGESKTSSALHARNGNRRDSSTPKPEQSHPGSAPFSLPLAKCSYFAAQPRLGNRYYLHQASARLDVSGCDTGLVFSLCSQLGTGSNTRNAIRCGRGFQGTEDCHPRNPQQRPGKPLYQFPVSQSGSRFWGQGEHGRPWASHGQHLYGKALAKPEVRGGVSQGLRVTAGGQDRHCQLLGLLQQEAPTSVTGLQNTGDSLLLKVVKNGNARGMRVNRPLVLPPPNKQTQTLLKKTFMKSSGVPAPPPGRKQNR